MGNNDLRRLPPALRILASGFLISLGLAYAVALLFVFVRTDMKPAGIASQYRGDSGAMSGALESTDASAPEEEENAIPGLQEEWKRRSAGMDFPKPLKDMILTTHLHMLSISVILFLLGGIFACSSFPEKAKGYIIAAGFAGLVMTYACMWALRYVGPAFAPGVFLFGFLQALSMAVQFFAGLRDLFFPGRARQAA